MLVMKGVKVTGVEARERPIGEVSFCGDGGRGDFGDMEGKRVQ